jgi:hypothetical protein
VKTIIQDWFFVNDWEFLDQMNDYQLNMKYIFHGVLCWGLQLLVSNVF